MITIDRLDDGWEIIETVSGWKYYVYPDDREIRNNGKRYHLKTLPQGHRLDLPINWTMGDVVHAIIKKLNEVELSNEE